MDREWKRAGPGLSRERMGMARADPRVSRRWIRMRNAGGLLAAVLVLVGLGACMNNKAAETIRAQEAPRMVDLFRGSAGARERVRASRPGMGGEAGPQAVAPTGPVCRCPAWAMWPCGPACVEAERERRADRAMAWRLELAEEGKKVCRRWLFAWPCEAGQGNGTVAADGTEGRPVPDRDPSAATVAATGARETEVGPGPETGVLADEEVAPEREPESGAANEGGSTAERIPVSELAAEFPEVAFVEGRGGVVDYTRTVHNELDFLFPRLPNPDILIYVYPHLATDERVPVPGYTTAVPLYERVEYALPGEIEEVRR